MTRLVVSLDTDGPKATLERALSALDQGADMVELRLDFWSVVDQHELAAVVSRLGTRCVVTCRSVEDGGRFTGGAMQRLDLLASAASNHAGMVDFEYRDYRRSAEIRRQVDRGKTGSKLLVSYHDAAARPARLYNLVREMNQVEACDVVKIAWKPANICENFDAIDIVRASEKPTVAICLGPAGLMSRVLAPKFGGALSYCAAQAGAETATGQLTLEEMKSVYRFDRIGPATRVFGVIGAPVLHSLSPAVHNAAFAALDMDAVYLPLHVEPTYEHFVDFLRECRRRDWMDFGGMSVTLPHKENALRFLRGRCDAPADRIGAVNTLLLRDGEVHGANTDCAAGMDAISSALQCERDELKGLAVEVLGAGGVARSIAAELCAAGCRVSITNRTPERAEELAGRFECAAHPWERRCRAETQLLVNCTSVGMSPAVDESPVPAARLREGLVVFDVVYNPVETRLLREARQIGCKYIGGFEMFVNQAAMQFKLWTGKDAPKDVMREAARARLTSG